MNCYLNKTRLPSSENICQIIDLIQFINANLVDFPCGLSLEFFGHPALAESVL